MDGEWTWGDQKKTLGFNQQKLRFNGTIGCEKARIGIQPDLNQQKLGFKF